MNDFDKFADIYNDILVNDRYIKCSGFSPVYFDEYKVKEVARVIGKEAFKSLNILDFGCGVGKSIPFLAKYFPNSKIIGIDISEESIKSAKENCSDISNVSLYTCSKNISDLGQMFNLIFVANIFHHIPKYEREDVFFILDNHLKEDGSMFIFEHNPINPLTKKFFRQCILDADCEMIKPKELINIMNNRGDVTIVKRYIVFFPWFMKALSFLEPLLSFVPFGAQYYLLYKRR